MLLETQIKAVDNIDEIGIAIVATIKYNQRHWNTTLKTARRADFDMKTNQHEAPKQPKI